MRELNKQEIQVIARAVKSRQELVSNKVSIWKFVYQEFNIGSPEGDKYRLTRDDYKRLRGCIESISGIDPLKYDEQAASKERIAASKSLGPEKHAKESPTYHRINIAVHSGCVILKTGEGILPPGTVLNVRYDDIPVPDAVIICENLEVFNQWYRVNLPVELHNTIACYRGHDGTQTKNLKGWLEEIQDLCKIIIFPDFDPSGIKNALSSQYPGQSVLIPTSIVFKHGPYHRNLFLKQFKDMSEIKLIRSVSIDILDLINSLEECGVAYTQELMVANQQGLKMVDIKYEKSDRASS